MIPSTAKRRDHFKHHLRDFEARAASDSDSDEEELRHEQPRMFSLLTSNAQQAKVIICPQRQPPDQDHLPGPLEQQCLTFGEEADFCLDGHGDEGEDEEADFLVEEEEDDEDFMRLDTIVEEDEESALGSQQSADLLPSSSARICANGHKPAAQSLTAAGAIAESHATAGHNKLGAKQTTSGDDVDDDDRLPCSRKDAANDSGGRPLTERQPLTEAAAAASRQLVNSISNNCMRKFATSANDMINLVGKQSQQTTVVTAATKPSSGNKTISSSLSSENFQPRRIANNLQRMHQPNALPSTNRLISEHQARQQQALFKALAERQKLLDELGDESADLLAVGDITSAGRMKLQRQRRLKRKRRRRRREEDSAKQGNSEDIPLSAVDLSSMSDRMLDDLMGHIAPASSSSISSNGESLDSMSSGEDDDGSGGDDESTSNSDQDQYSQTANAQPQQEPSRQHRSQPNIIGIHEDEERVQATKSRRDSCKNSSSLRYDNDHEDDDHDNHELVVDLKSASFNQHSSKQFLSQLLNNSASSLSPGAGPRAPMTSELTSLNDDRLSRTSSSSANEPFDDQSQTKLANQQPAPPPQQSVESVLSQMLEALNEIGSDNQEQLNELLERGFAHLESLLNCSLGQQTQLQRSQQPAPGNHQKLISGQPSCNQQHHTLLSKDSDYGSDTQSAADCSNVTHSQASPTSLLIGSQVISESPSPTSMNTSASSTTSSSGPPGLQPSSSGGNKLSASTLSPLAIELSFRLAESLHRLAQQQQQLKRATSEDRHERGREEQAEPSQQAPKRQPMKSVVMINCNGGGGGGESPGQTTRSPSVASIVSSGSNSVAASPSLARNMTPTSHQADHQDHRQRQRDKQQQQPRGQSARPQFKTCVNIGGSAQQNKSSVLITNGSPNSETSEDLGGGGREAATSPGQQIIRVVSNGPGNFERRRSSRSLRRRPSFSGSLTGSIKEPGAPRPASPIPKSIMQQPQDSQQQQQEKQQKKQDKQLQRALVLAQKYNYSPAKLAASKLSSKLQLKELTSAISSPAINNAQQQQQQQQQKPAGGQSHYYQEQRRLSEFGAIELQNPTATTKGRSLVSNNGLAGLNGSKIDPLGVRPRTSFGRVQLDISYFAKSGSLTVHVIQCLQLLGMAKRRTTSNPYVKLYLLPDRNKSGKRKSSVIKGTLEPKFDEKFTFGPGLLLSHFQDKILWLSVWHKDRLGRNDFLGELLLPLSEVRKQLLSSDLCQSTGLICYELSEKFEPGDEAKLAYEQTLAAGKQSELIEKLNEYHKKASKLAGTTLPPINVKTTQLPQQMNAVLGPSTSDITALISGQLFVALKFVPENNQLVSSRNANHLEGELHVIIKEAKNIAGFESPLLNQSEPRQLPSGPLPNPYCKCYLLSSNGVKLAKHKTPHLKRTANPKWDYECAFNSIKFSRLAGQAIEIQMFHRDSILVNNESLGGIRLCSAVNSNDSSFLDSQSINSSSTGGTLNTQLQADQLCGEREAKLWAQMLARPNIWVYGELKLRALRPLLVKED